MNNSSMLLRNSFRCLCHLDESINIYIEETTHRNDFYLNATDSYFFSNMPTWEWCIPRTWYCWPVYWLLFAPLDCSKFSAWIVSNPVHCLFDCTRICLGVCCSTVTSALSDILLRTILYQALTQGCGFFISSIQHVRQKLTNESTSHNNCVNDKFLNEGYSFCVCFCFVDLSMNCK